MLGLTNKCSVKRKNNFLISVTIAQKDPVRVVQFWPPFNHLQTHPIGMIYREGGTKMNGCVRVVDIVHLLKTYL